MAVKTTQCALSATIQTRTKSGWHKKSEEVSNYCHGKIQSTCTSCAASVVGSGARTGGHDRAIPEVLLHGTVYREKKGVSTMYRVGVCIIALVR